MVERLGFERAEREAEEVPQRRIGSPTRHIAVRPFENGGTFLEEPGVEVIGSQLSREPAPVVETALSREESQAQAFKRFPVTLTLGAVEGGHRLPEEFHPFLSQQFESEALRRMGDTTHPERGKVSRISM